MGEERSRWLWPLAVAVTTGLYLYMVSVFSLRLPGVSSFASLGSVGPLGTKGFQRWLEFSGMSAEAKDVVDAIYNHQNPKDCSKVKYFIVPPWNHGMSAGMRTYSWILFGAFLQDRVAIFPPYFRPGKDDPWLWTDDQYCGNHTRNLDCYFEPYSRCQHYVTEEMARNAPVVSDVWTVPEDPVVWLTEGAWFGSRWHMIDTLPHSEDKDVKAWLYPMEMRYVARPNERTRAWARGYLEENLYRYSARSRGEERVFPDGPPAQAICMHVRQSDKEQEMKLHPVSDYLAAADAFRRNLSVDSVFVTTEAPAVIEEILSEATARKYPDFTFYYTKHERVPGAVAVTEVARQLGPSYSALVSLSNLFLSTHPNCVAHVLTTASNWCSLINDIRVTDGQRDEDWRLVDFEESLY